MPISFSADAIVPMSGNTNHSTTRCNNLRPIKTNNGNFKLKPVGAPVPVASGSWRIMTRMRPDRIKKLIILANGCELAYIDVSIKPDPLNDGIIRPTAIASLGSDILCVNTSGPMLTAMCADGVFSARYDCGSQSWTTLKANAFPSLSLIADTLADASSTVASRKMAFEYTVGQNHLSSLDVRNLTSDLRDAYSGIYSQAVGAAAFCAPVLCRYRLIGASGETLFTSAPVLLAPADSCRISEPVIIRSTDRYHTEPFTLSTPLWRLRLASAEPVDKSVAQFISRIEILASPQFHPFDPQADATFNVIPPRNSSDFIRASLPGAARSISAGNQAIASARLRQAIAVMPQIESVIAVINSPFGDLPLDIIPDLQMPARDLVAECHAIEKAMNDKPMQADPELVMISEPHRFTAQCCAAASGMTLYGGLSALRFDGYTAESLAAAVDGDGPWHAAVAVQFASGDEQVVAISQGLRGAPLSFNPVLTYPAPDATSISITVSRGGVVRHGTFNLSPDASRRHAVFIHSSLQPFELPDRLTAFVPPAARIFKHHLPSAIALAPSTPFGFMRPAIVSSLGDAQIIALKPAFKSASGLDFSKQHFIAFTASGIFRLRASRASPARIEAQLIDSSVLSSPDAVTIAGSQLIAILSDKLVSISSNSVTTLADNFHADTLAYSPHFDEVWASSGSGSTVYSIDCMALYTRDESLQASAFESLACCDGRIVDLACEQPRDRTFINYVCRTGISNYHSRIKSFAIDMYASALDNGEISLSRLNHDTPEPIPSLSLKVDGAIKLPLRRSIAALPARKAEISVQGRASADTIISSVSITV